MKRICSRIVMIFSLAIMVFLMNSSTTYANWLQVTSGNIGLGYSALSDTITFTEYDKIIKIKIGNHFLDSGNNLYIYMNDHKIAGRTVPRDLKKYTIKQVQDVDTGRVFYTFNARLGYSPALMMGYDPINKKWQTYIDSTSAAFPVECRRLGYPSFYVNNDHLYFRYFFPNIDDLPTPPDAIYSLVWDAGANWIGYSML